VDLIDKKKNYLTKNQQFNTNTVRDIKVQQLFDKFTSKRWQKLSLKKFLAHIFSFLVYHISLEIFEFEITS